MFFLLACAASVTAEAIDGGFGPGASAIWTHAEQSGVAFEGLAISNISGLCVKQQELSAATDALLDAQVDAASETYCADIEEPWRAYTEAQMRIAYEGATAAVFLVVGEAFEVGDYTLGPDTLAVVQVVTHSELDAQLDAFDPGGSLSDSCGLSSDGVEYDEWAIEDGELTLDSVAAEDSVSGSVDGRMMTLEGVDEGAFSATFNASWCDLGA